MKIISHRGFWLSEDQKNSRRAFDHTIASGYGTETDVRDCDGRLVVSHDPAGADAMLWSDLLDLFEGTGLPLAVNIKADGLSGLLKQCFAGRDQSWFAFDMSGPETVRYAQAGLPFYTRHSDVEPQPILYDRAAGVWLDDFGGGWIDAGHIAAHVAAGKAVCVVSPDLHGRDPEAFWETLRGIAGDVTLCTDFPDRAKDFFR